MVTQGGRDGTERNRVGPTRAASTTGLTRAATETLKGQGKEGACKGTYALFFVILSLI